MTPASASGVPPGVPKSRPAAPARIGQPITKLASTKSGTKASTANGPSDSPKSRTSSAVGSVPVTIMVSRIAPTTTPPRAMRQIAARRESMRSRLVAICLARMTAAELRRLCLGFPGAVEEYPFGTVTAVFKVEGKIFALSAAAIAPAER